MKELPEIAIDELQRSGASYGDIRVVTERQNNVMVRQRSVKKLEDTESRGYGIRVLLNGAWGFASDTELTKEAVARTAREAVAVARASARAPKGEPAVMAAEEGRVDTYVTPVGKDPFEIPNREKAELLLEINNIALGVQGISLVFSALYFKRIHRIIATTDGSFLDMTHTVSEPAINAVAVVGQESQDRAYQHGGRAAGWEFVEKEDLVGQASVIAREAVIKAKAEDTPIGKFDLILDPMNLCLTMHESVGHPTELDRILGWEANMAGTSFVTPDSIGSLKYGSDIVNFTADNTLGGGLATWGYDDDGVPGRKWPIVRDGVLVGVNATRETAPLIGLDRAHGTSRAESFSTFPITRIPNLYMEPGTDDVTAEEMISGTDRGIYIQGMGSFSIDQKRINLQFGGDFFQMIENGKLTKPLKKVTYQARTTDFWGACDAIAGPADWQTHGVSNCGKGEPMQTMMMTHGASTCRFRNIDIGGATA